ncbi:hypothetical protein [Ferrimonas kyonanensis]|uniref:hypothetical protein n=1 Tax=Ferrimonas kyonanensis TaxID=364763 RepID=UPI0003FC4F0E|nr:hypothetical protein [Ferrimonas kyonanensis]
MKEIDFTAVVEGLVARNQKLKADVESHLVADQPVPAAVQTQTEQALKFTMGLLELKGVA